MKKFAILLSLLLVCVVSFVPMLTACNDGESGPSVGGGSGERLYVYNWEDYIDEELIDEFEDYYREITGKSISVVYSTFDTNETMMTQIVRGDAVVDLICPSEYAIEKLMTQTDGSGKNYLLNLNDVYAELTEEDSPYLQSVRKVEALNGRPLNDLLSTTEPDVVAKISDIFGKIDVNGKVYDMTEYMVPYMWGTLGILYNTKYVTEEDLATGWGLLWNKSENPDLQGNILMKDSIRDSYVAAVMYMYEYDMLPEGYSDFTVEDLINCTDKAVLDAAEKVLTEQRSIISGYEVDFGKDDMINEIVYVDLAWSGDALWAIEEGGYDEETGEYQLGYYVPEIGSNIWYDGWAMTKNAQNKLASLMFIDFMSRPMSGIRNSMYIGYTSAVAKELLQADEDVLAFIEENEYDVEEYFADEGRYPTIGDNMGVMRDFGASNDALVQMWERSKAGGFDLVLLWVLIAIVAVIALALGGYFAKEAIKMRRKVK